MPSLLLRSIWYGQNADSLGIPVRNGRLEMVRTLLALGLTPLDNNEIVRDALESFNANT
jgi:hypothetical protein